MISWGACEYMNSHPGKRRESNQRPDQTQEELYNNKNSSESPDCDFF